MTGKPSSAGGAASAADRQRNWALYPERVSSRLNWLGPIPSHWGTARLKYCVRSLVAGGTPDTGNESYWGTAHTPGVPWVAISDMTGNPVVETTARTVTAKGVSSRGLPMLPAGTLLYSMYASLGKVALLGVPAATNQAILGITSRDEITTTAYLKWWLVHMEEHLPTLCSSNTQDNLNAQKVGNLPILLPHIGEQRAIAAFLDRETARTDALVAKKEQLIELLLEKRAALIAHAVTQGLDPKAKMKDSGVGWLGKIPAHWEAIRLKFVAKLESGHTPSRSVPEYWEDCTIPWVSLNDVGSLDRSLRICETVNLISELGLANSAAKMLPAETVILSRDATIGRCTILGKPMATSQHFVNWTCGPRLLPEYLLWLFREPMKHEFARLSMGSTIGTIGMPDVNSFRVTLPPVPEQRRIVAHVNGESQRLDALMAKVREAIGKLKEYRTALISAAVTGQIDVREVGA